MKMSQSHRLSRVASDFSIDRILAQESDRKNREPIVARGGNEEFSYRRPNRHGDSAQTERVPPNSNVDSCSRLQFVDEQSPNRHDPRATTSVPNTFSSSCENLKSLKFERSDLTWLHCTRYRPPKLPRKSSSGKTGKRRPGAHPRIPFTATQLQILEEKYRFTAYLSRRDVIHLSTTLRLPQSRVKIWFQNRRARDRRETGISGSNIAISSEDTLADKSQSLPIEKTPSTSPVCII